MSPKWNPLIPAPSVAGGFVMAEEGLHFHRGAAAVPDHYERAVFNLAAKVLENAKRQYHSGDPVQVREAKLWLHDFPKFPALVGVNQVMHTLGLDRDALFSHFPVQPMRNFL
jgi:hypothetical protein